MRIKRLAVLLLFSLTLFPNLFLSAQDTKTLDKADKFYKMGLYPKAIKLYEDALKLKTATDKKETVPYARNLADAYKQSGNLKTAEAWYGKLAKGNHNTAQDRIAYINLLRYKGKYEDAKKWAETWRGSMGDPLTADRLIESCDFALAGMQETGRYKISKNAISGPGGDSWAIPYEKGLMLSTTGKKTWKGLLPGGRLHSPFYDLAYAEQTVKGWKVKKLKVKGAGGLHEGPAAVSPDGEYLYFTAGNYLGGKRKKPKAEGWGSSKILVARKSGKKWKDTHPLSFNSDDYSCMHPALSPDGKTMVFASDIGGGLGGFDLYVSTMDEKGAWSIPENLGGRINSTGDELFPYMTIEGTLFFSSDGLIGFGGLDIYSAESEGDKWGNVKNMGYPLNTSRDEMSISVSKGRARGTFTSDRPKGQGLDDLYTFSRNMGLEGVVVDSRSKLFIPGATVQILDANNRAGNYVTDDAGKFLHFGDAGKDYFITVNAPGYLETKKRISTASINPMGDYPFLIEIEKELVTAVLGTIVDAKEGKPLSDVVVTLDKDGTPRDYSVDEDGTYKIELEENADYSVKISKKGYRPEMRNLSTKGLKGPKEFRFDAMLKEGLFLTLQGATVSKGTQQPIGGVVVDAVKEGANEPTLTLATPSDGKFWMYVDPADSDYLLATKEGYFPLRSNLPDAEEELQPGTIIPTKLELVGSEPGAVIKTIYYDYNQASLKKAASQGLEEIVSFMAQNPGTHIELDSYTDSRGGSSYNLKLSQKRANAARDYLISRGISRDRISAKGLGETNLLNQCKDGVECTDEEHALNRRAEVKITKME